MAFAQFDAKGFKSKSNETIRFTDNYAFSVRLWYHHMLTKHDGKGIYRIAGNKLIATFQAFQNKDTSDVKIIQSIPCDTTSINIVCKIVSNDEKCYPCEFITWQITNENDSIIEKGEKEMGENSIISLHNITVSAGDKITFIGNGFTANFGFPLIPKHKTSYLVTLRERISYIEKGELIFKIIKHKRDVSLKLINGKKYVGFNTMEFYPIE
ncbi:MAG: hypothetical protein LBV75_05085 [Paludibacter sp.]|jgi:hypothetical protein|nr:hypothetical protein [Paludibacter sp.]